MPKTKKRLREAAQPEPICTDKKERKIKKTKKNKKAKLAEMISRAAVPLSTRKLLVIDLNKVLISRKPMTSFYSIRPHAREFLSEMAKLFDLAVWTSMTNTSAKPIIRDLFVADCLVFRWYQSKCTIDSDDAATVEDKKPNFVKQLSKVWEEFPQYNHTNTVRNLLLNRLSFY